MARRSSLFVFFVSIFLCAFSAAVAAPTPRGTAADAFSKLPLTFEENTGQVDGAVRFLSRTPRYTMFFTKNETVLTLRGGSDVRDVVRWRFRGANDDPRITGEHPVGTRTNYFRGNDRRQWRSDVANFGQVRYEGVYPGIDVVYRGNQRQVEYDFLVAPQANPEQIRLAFDGVESIALDRDGQLVLRTANGQLAQPRPLVYQEIDGRRHIVDGRYTLRGHEVGFALGAYDRTRPLVIDPVLAWSTFLGGSLFDSGCAITVDGSGNIYVVGFAESLDYPTVNAIQTTSYDYEGFITKINSSGTSIVWSTYLGGNGGNEYALGVAVDSSQNVYVVGDTNSTDFPGVSGSSIQSTFGGHWRDMFAVKINAAGNAIVHSTYLGGSGDDHGWGVACDNSGNMYVTGGISTVSWIGGSALQPSPGGNGDAFVVKIDNSGAAVYATYLGGSGGDGGSEIEVDSSGNAYVLGGTSSTDFPGVSGSSLQSTNAGNGDAFLAVINAAGTSVTSTYYGGSGGEWVEHLARDSSGNLYIFGETNGTSLPGVTGSSVQPSNAGGPNDLFVAKINSSMTGVVWATFFGGTNGDYSSGFGVDGSGNVYFATATNSTDYPVTSPTLQGTYGGGDADSAVTRINAAGTAVNWSTYLGGSSAEIAQNAAVDASGNVYVTGWTDNSSFPGTSGSAIQPAYGGNGDAFIAKISNGASPSLTSISPASGVPGTQVTLTGTGFGAVRGTGSVWLGNKLAGSIVSWSDTQVVATVATNVASGSATVQQGGTWSNSISFTIITPTISSISPTSARAGDPVTITGTNFGATQGSGQVWLGSKLAGSIVSWSNTQIVATVASGATSGNAQVQQSGVWGNQIAITILTPDVTSVSPTTARAGDSITITGTSFGSTQGTGSVWLGSKLAGSIVSWSDTQIVATVASGSVTGTAQVQQGGVWDNYGTFTVITPVLSSLSPTSGPVGTQVTFTGTGFGATQGSGKVWLANKYATIVSWSDTQIVATVIAGSTTSASQVYQNGVWSNTITFTVTP